MSSSEWREVTLSDISIGNKGDYGIGASAVEYSKDLYTYLRITDISDEGILKKDSLMSVDDEDARNYLLKPNDIVFARTGNSTGRSYFYDGSDGELVYAGFLIKFSLDPSKVNPKYLRYYTLSNEYKDWVSSFSTGSTRGNINAKTYGSMKIKLPPTDQQDFLVQILSTLDDKIEVNNQINKTLENMAQAIFKQWFMDFEFPNEDGEPYKSSGGEMIESELGLIPKGWEVRTVDDITAKFTTGLNPRKNFVLGTGNNFYVTIKNMGNQQVFLDDRCDKIDDQALVIINKRSDLRKGDVLFSGIGTIGRTYLIDTIPKNWNISESIFTLRAYDERVSLFLYQLLLSESFQGYAKQLASGSVQKGIRMGDMKIFKFAYSESVVINNYHKIMSSVIDKIKVLQRENIMLSNLRDTLLPKLMSGEIRVPLDEECEAS